MSDLMFQMAMRVVITGLLSLIIWLCADQIYRIWFERTVVLNTFSYFKSNEQSTTGGLYFTNLVSQQLLALRDLYVREEESADSRMPNRGASEMLDEIASIDFVGQGRAMHLDVPSIPQAPFSSIDITAYGVKVSELYKGFTRWIEQPYAIEGMVSELPGKLRVTATLQNPPGLARPIHWVLDENDADSASFQLACQILYMLMSPASNVIRATPSVEFCAFTKAWRNYQVFRQGFGIIRDEERKDVLVNAAKLIEGLTLRNSRFPYVHKLAALIFREQSRPHDALTAIVRYRELIAAYEISDLEAVRLESVLHAGDSGAPVVNARNELVGMV
jgi:hypothetical protein